MRFYVVAPLVVLVTVLCSVAALIAGLIDRSGKLYFALMRLWARTLLVLFGVRVRSRGAEHLRAGQCYVYLANHASYLDIIALVAAIPDRIRFIFKRELARIPVFGWSLALSPNILINRADAREARASIERAAAEIGTGASVVIFPEGTRTSDGALGQFKRGGFLLATLSGVPLVPVAIQGSYALMPRHRLRVEPGSVSVIIGTPIPPLATPSRTAETELQHEVRSQLESMLETLTTRP